MKATVVLAAVCTCVCLAATQAVVDPSEQAVPQQPAAAAPPAMAQREGLEAPTRNISQPTCDPYYPLWEQGTCAADREIAVVPGEAVAVLCLPQAGGLPEHSVCGTRLIPSSPFAHARFCPIAASRPRVHQGPGALCPMWVNLLLPVSDQDRYVPFCRQPPLGCVRQCRHWRPLLGGCAQLLPQCRWRRGWRFQPWPFCAGGVGEGCTTVCVCWVLHTALMLLPFSSTARLPGAR